jgi:DNA-binding NarL/FixJ family response regulator
MGSLKIIFTDDVKKYRSVILSELAPLGVDCIGEASNGTELLRLLMRLKPDVVLLDLEMPVMNGNEALSAIMSQYPGTKVIILSMHYEGLLVEDYIRRGARGYISKDEIAGDIGLLAEAIRRVKGGEIFIHHLPEEKQLGAIHYSNQQKKIAPMICQGFTNEQIAEELCIGVRGVEKQRSKIYSKVGGKAIDFYRYAFSRGLHFLSIVSKRAKVTRVEKTPARM